MQKQLPIIAILSITFILIGCSDEPDQKQASQPMQQSAPATQQPATMPEAANKLPGDHPPIMPAEHPPIPSNSPTQPDQSAVQTALTNSGEVLTVEQAKPYTYLQVMTPANNQKLWLATTQLEISPGEQVRWGNFIVMKNFQSKTLERTFNQVLFVDALEKATP